MPRQVTLARRLSPWWRRSRVPWATVLPLGAIVVLAVAAVNERRTVRKLVDGQALLLEDARRAMLMDDLLGTRAPSMRIETLQGEVVDFRREIAGSPTWILNPNACAGCLDHMPKWNRTAPDALGGNLVLVGVSRARAREIVRDLTVRIPVYLDRDGDVLRLIRGYGFPSVHLARSAGRASAASATGWTRTAAGRSLSVALMSAGRRERSVGLVPPGAQPPFFLKANQPKRTPK